MREFNELALRELNYYSIESAFFCVFSPCIRNFVEEIFENKCERYSLFNVIKLIFVRYSNLLSFVPSSFLTLVQSSFDDFKK